MFLFPDHYLYIVTLNIIIIIARLWWPIAAIAFFQFINENKKKSKMKLTRNFELNQLKGEKKINKCKVKVKVKVKVKQKHFKIEMKEKVKYNKNLRGLCLP